MPVLKLIRQPTIANTKTVYEFDVLGYAFGVKNLSGGDIYVGFSEEEDKTEMLIIPNECYQMVTGLQNNGSDKVVIMPTATSETGVEVQCLLW